MSQNRAAVGFLTSAENSTIYPTHSHAGARSALTQRVIVRRRSRNNPLLGGGTQPQAVVAAEFGAIQSELDRALIAYAQEFDS